jgi:hypothetical protein
MTSNHEELARQFENFSDEELIRRGNSGGLTDAAQAVATAELERRSLPAPILKNVEADDEATEIYDGDMVIVARYLEPTEAHMLCSCLQAAGVPAITSDTNFVQGDFLLTVALGGAKIQVPKDFAEEALQVIQAFKRGDFALGDDFDTGESSPSN